VKLPIIPVILNSILNNLRIKRKPIGEPTTYGPLDLTKNLLIIQSIDPSITGHTKLPTNCFPILLISPTPKYSTRNNPAKFQITNHPTILPESKSCNDLLPLIGSDTNIMLPDIPSPALLVKVNRSRINHTQTQIPQMARERVLISQGGHRFGRYPNLNVTGLPPQGSHSDWQTKPILEKSLQFN
jgi:hypothetical protein